MEFFPSQFSGEANRYIKKLDEITKSRVKEKIEKLEQNPFPKEVERVGTYKGEKIFRVRVGDQRILYIVRYNPNKLLIVRVNKRSRVYER